MNNYNTSAFCLRIFNDMPLDIKVLKFYSHHLQLSGSYQFTISVQVTNPLIISDLLEKHGCLTFYDQYIHGYIEAITVKKYDNQGIYYDLVLSCPLSQLKRKNHDRVFLNRDVIDILETILNQASGSWWQYRFIIQRSFKKMSVSTQHQETDFNFFHRLLLEESLHYYFVNTGQCVTLVISDSFQNNLAKKIRYVHSKNLVSDEKYAFSLIKQRSLLCCQYTVMTNDFSLSLGDMVCFDYLLNNTADKYYRIVKIAYSGHENVGFNDALKITKQRFLSQLTLLPVRAHSTLLSSRYKKPSVSFLNAAIDGQTNETPDLDEQGRYRVKYYFAEKNQNQSQRLFAIQPLSGVQQCFHFPLYKDTNVSVIFINSDIDQPLVMGALSSEVCLDPVTSLNRTQHVIRSYLGHELTFNDNTRHQSIVLQTADKQQLLHFNNGEHQSFLSLLNKAGELQFTAAKKFQVSVSNDYYQMIKRSHQIHVKQTYRLQTKQGCIIFLSNKQLMLKSGETGYLQSDSFQCESVLNTELLAKNDVLLFADKDISCQARDSSLHLKAGQMVALQAPSISIVAGNSCLEIQGNGVVLKGSNIQLIGLVS